MKLFIAEKPSVAKAIAAELGVSGRGDGFINCRNDVVVTWCFGHLLEQAEPDAYLPDDIPKTKKGRKIWRMQDLPIFPQHWLMEAKTERGAKKQLGDRQIAKSAATVVNAGDPDREETPSRRRRKSTKGPSAWRFSGFTRGPASFQKRLATPPNSRCHAGLHDAGGRPPRARGPPRANLTRLHARGRRRTRRGPRATPTLFMVARRDSWCATSRPCPTSRSRRTSPRRPSPYCTLEARSPTRRASTREGRLSSTRRRPRARRASPRRKRPPRCSPPRRSPQG